MALNNKEIEIQVRIEKPEVLLDFLNKNAQFKNEQRQVDEYFTPSDRDFTSVRPVREWLRVRESAKGSSVNYKIWNYDENGKSSYADEFETPVSNVVAMRNIFERIKCRKIAVVDKTRKTWLFKDYEVTIDSVKNLGEFVEIEYSGKDENIDAKKVIGEMISFLKDIGCGKTERNYVGYPFQILFPEEVKFEEV
jgi:adenylate cyclase class 2